VNKVVRIGKSLIGRGYPVFVIAEAGVNHNGDLGLATELIDVAISAGANAVKFQTFMRMRSAATDAPKAEYQLATTTPGQSQLRDVAQARIISGRTLHFESLLR
jgi:N-acetylneuraminate synthase/N,N'-diacetyllegionaminate synthase